MKKFGKANTELISEEMEDLSNKIEKLCHQNVSASYLKLAAQTNTAEDIEKFARNALKSCNKALEIDANSWKALLRKGEAYVLMNSPDEAKTCLTNALSLCGDDEAAKTNIKKEMIKVEKLYKKFEVKEKKMAAAMFGAGNYSDDRSIHKDPSSTSLRKEESKLNKDDRMAGSSSSGAR